LIYIIDAGGIKKLVQNDIHTINNGARGGGGGASRKKFDKKNRLGDFLRFLLRPKHFLRFIPQKTKNKIKEVRPASHVFPSPQKTTVRSVVGVRG